MTAGRELYALPEKCMHPLQKQVVLALMGKYCKGVLRRRGARFWVRLALVMPNGGYGGVHISSAHRIRQCQFLSRRDAAASVVLEISKGLAELLPQCQTCKRILLRGFKS